MSDETTYGEGGDYLDSMQGLAEQAHGAVFDQAADESYDDAPQSEPSAGERPEGLLDTFNSVEAQAEAYQNLRAAYTQATQERAALQDYVEQLTAAQSGDFDETVYAPPASPQERFAAINQRVNEVLAERQAQAGMVPGSPAFQQSVAAQADQILQTFPDYPHLAGEVETLLAANPDALENARTPQEAAQVIQAAANAVRTTRQQRAAEQVAAQRLMKSQAQTLAGAAGRPERSSTWEDKWQSIVNAPSGSYADLSK